MKNLRSRLAYEPHELKFGTSGRRGEVVHLTQLEIYINVTGELEYLLSLPPTEGGIVRGDEFYFAYDLRPSSTRFVPEQQGRGEIAQSVMRAVAGAGLRPVNLGAIPTPALASYAFERKRGSIMITGSHIPFDRNGYKLNTATGELLKSHEAPVNAAVTRVRQRIYAEPFETSQFDERGLVRHGHTDLPLPDDSALHSYIRRYLDFFEGLSLAGKRIIVYQHSAVGRDLLPSILNALGAEVVTAGRSDHFVPIDTENIDAAQLAVIQSLADSHGPAFAVVSMDGDSDRPLVLGLRRDNSVQFFGGDLLGMVTAEFLHADSVVVPISCNDAIDRGPLAPVVEPKTKIGSPFVIEGMERAKANGRRIICGWEANGGFLTGSEIVREGHRLSALPTRDAVLPILCVLFAAHKKRVALTELFGELPARFSKAGLLRAFPNAVARRLLAALTPQVLVDEFSHALGFGDIANIDHTDGVRVSFSNGDIAHLRASGNADELRIYAVADTQQRADEIVRMGTDEPDGVLRRLEKRLC
jgi:phosphomannomutase